MGELLYQAGEDVNWDVQPDPLMEEDILPTVEPSLDANLAAAQQELATQAGEPTSTKGEVFKPEDIYPSEKATPVNAAPSPLVQERAPEMGLLNMAAFRQANAARGNSPEDVAAYIQKVSSRQAGVENGQAWYQGDDGKRYAVDPQGFDLLDVTEVLPGALHTATQVAGSVTPMGLATRVAIGGGIAAGTQNFLNDMASRTLGSDEDYTKMATEIALNSAGSAVGPWGEAWLKGAGAGAKGAIDLAKEYGPYVTGPVAKGGSAVARGIGKGVETIFQKLTTFKPEEIFKKLQPTLTQIKDYKDREATAKEGVGWLYDNLPGSMSGYTAKDISDNITTTAGKTGAWLGNLYRELQAGGVKISWKQASPYFDELRHLASGADPTVPDTVKANAARALEIAEKQWQAGGSSILDAMGKPASKGKGVARGIAEVWANGIDEIEKELGQQLDYLPNGTVKGMKEPAVRVLNAAKRAYSKMIPDMVPDAAVNKAMKDNSLLTELKPMVQGLARKTGDSILRSVNKAHHYLEALNPVGQRGEAVEFKQDFMQRAAPWLTGFGTAAGTYGILSDDPKYKALGAVSLGYQALHSAPYIMAKRAAALGEMTPQIEQLISSKTNWLIDKTVKKPAELAEGVADLILTNPTVQKFVVKGGLRTPVDYLQEFMEAPQGKMQEMLDQLGKVAPEAFKPEPNKIAPEEKIAYDNRLMESMMNRKIGAVDAFKAHQKIMKDGTVTGSGW